MPAPCRFDFLSAYHGLWADATKLRIHALNREGHVRNPAVLDRAIRIRLKLLSQGIELEARILSAGAQRAFYEALIAEIADESPELHRRLVNRLRDFSDQFASQQSRKRETPVDA